MAAISCTDRCGRSAADEDAATSAGWSYLSITGRWRCGACEGELMRARSMVGADQLPLQDQLPPTSRGALPRETASSILPPTVKP